MVSATNRVLGVVPRPTKFGIKLLAKEARRFKCMLVPVDPMTDDEFLACYDGPKKARYVTAINSLINDPITIKDSHISAFIKAEKCDPGHKVNPDPRMIQARSPRYNYLLGRWLKPLEHQIYRKLRDGINSRMVMKGLNQRERAAAFVNKWAAFDDPVAIPLDGSRWDKHIWGEVLNIEHSIYLAAIRCSVVALLLKWQRRNICKTRNLVFWIVWWRRMSGDVNTGLGNSVLMSLMLKAIFRTLGIKKWAAVVDGDDGVPVVERRDLVLVQKYLSKLFLDFGQEVKLETPTSDIQKVKFCQTQLVWVDEEPIMVRDWKRCLSHDTSGVKNWGDPNVSPALLKAVGMCNLALHAGMPILQAHALACIRNAGETKARFDILALEDAWARYKTELGHPAALTTKAKAIKASTRLSFMHATGVSIEEQIDIESRLDSWQIDSFVPIDYRAERNSSWEDMTDPNNMPCVV